MEKRDLYVPFNYFSFQAKTNESDDTYIRDKAVYDLPGVFSSEELAARDDTQDVVDEIWEMLVKCGNMMRADYASDYDKEGNFESNGAENEYQLELGVSLGVLINPNDIIELAKGIKKSETIIGDKIDFKQDSIDKIRKMAYKGKVPIKVFVHCDTLLCDDYNELKIKGIDVTKEYKFGIVDIEKLCELLKSKGINISFSTNNSYDYMSSVNDKFKELFSNGSLSVEEFQAKASSIANELSKPDLRELNFDSYIENLIATRMQSTATISIPFSKYLKENGGHK